MVTTIKIKPLALQPGCTIGIVAPSSPINSSKLEAGIVLIKARGYQVEVGRHVLDRHPHNNYLAGRDEDRAADLNEMFTRKNIQAIICGGGGYGATRILPLLDWEVIQANPKLFVGFSDITSLHIALQQRGFVTIHGKMAASLPDLDSASAELFWSILENRNPYGLLPSNTETIRTIVPGVVEAELAGGCLSLLAHACGTPYAPNFTDKLVLIEDIGEAIYRADRDLTQLLQSAHLDRAAGFIIGEISGWEKQESEGTVNSLSELWRSFFQAIGKPAISGYPIGHIDNPLTIPLGIQTRLDATLRTVTLLETCVS